MPVRPRIRFRARRNAKCAPTIERARVRAGGDRVQGVGRRGDRVCNGVTAQREVDSASLAQPVADPVRALRIDRRAGRKRADPETVRGKGGCQARRERGRGRRDDGARGRECY